MGGDIMKRVFDVSVAESTNPEHWWWLSFSDPERPKGSQFLGVAIVKARGMGTATVAASLLGINPGGHVWGVAIDDERVPPPEYRERLLSRTDAQLAERAAIRPGSEPTPREP